MQYLGPQHTDFQNVRSLNREFLHLLAGRAVDAPLLRGLPDGLGPRLAGLRPAERKRLVDTPFLLFSFRERDNDYWGRLLCEERGLDLFAATTGNDDAAMRLIAAGLGFIWQLARQNTYSARLICGASLHWCEQLADKTLVELVTVAVTSLDILSVRAPGDPALWQKLLGSGVSSDIRVRRAAHMAALQRVLTQVYGGDVRQHARAARAGLAPTFKVADEMDR